NLGLNHRADAYQLDADAVRGRRRRAGGAVRFADGSWEVVSGGERTVIADSLGMRYLARLLGQPHRNIAAADLAGSGVDQLRQEVVDRTAIQNYRRQISELRSDIDEADEAADVERASRLRLELDQLVTHLEGQMRLGHRSRQFADNGERARTAVQKAIRRAIERIRAGAPCAGERLAVMVHTGSL